MRGPVQWARWGRVAGCSAWRRLECVEPWRSCMCTRELVNARLGCMCWSAEAGRVSYNCAMVALAQAAWGAGTVGLVWVPLAQQDRLLQTRDCQLNTDWLLMCAVCCCCVGCVLFWYVMLAVVGFCWYWCCSCCRIVVWGFRICSAAIVTQVAIIIAICVFKLCTELLLENVVQNCRFQLFSERQVFNKCCCFASCVELFWYFLFFGRRQFSHNQSQLQNLEKKCCVKIVKPQSCVELLFRFSELISQQQF